MEYVGGITAALIAFVIGLQYTAHKTMNIRSAVQTVIIAGVALASGNAQVPKPAKNLFDNGDFSAGAAKWTGDGKATVYKAELSSPSKTGSALDGLKPALRPELSTPQPPPTVSTPELPQPSTGLPPVKANADADRSYCINLSSRPQKFLQKISPPRSAKALKVSFRARTSNGFLSSRSSAGEFETKIVRQNGSWSSEDQKLGKDAGWQNFHFDYNVTDGDHLIEFVIQVHPGIGQLYFDDFVMESADQ